LIPCVLAAAVAAATAGKFPKRQCLFYTARIMLALQALHDKDYVFRDLKPENCLLAEDDQVKITGLGLATKITSKLHGAAGILKASINYNILIIIHLFLRLFAFTVD